MGINPDTTCPCIDELDPHLVGAVGGPTGRGSMDLISIAVGIGACRPVAFVQITGLPPAEVFLVVVHNITGWWLDAWIPWRERSRME